MNDLYRERLHLCLIQSDIDPVNIEGNLRRYERLLEGINGYLDLIIFPEMFASGFSDKVIEITTNYTVSCLNFLYRVAQRYGADVVASLPVIENGVLFNRLVWVRGKNIIGQYDKRHLFFGYEKQFYSKGKTKTIVNTGGWNFLPLICYDIRFPSWCRKRYCNNIILYDCLLFIANFPAARTLTFKSLLTARAIENQSYVIGVNRRGKDGFGTNHSGNSMVINPYGQIIAQAPKDEDCLLFADIDGSVLNRLRKSFPVYEDWDE